MRHTTPLTYVLDSKPKIICLRLLCNHPTEINGRQLSMIVGLSPTTVHKAMKELAEEQIVLLKNYGNSHIYQLNNNNPIVIDILKPMFNKEKVLLKELMDQIARKINKSAIKDKIVTVALFGSLNEGLEAPGSDIDICVVVNQASDKKVVEELLFSINSEIMSKMGMRIEPYIKTTNEFKKDQELGIIKSILKSNRVIYGNNLENIR